jgi:hypothetical protein
MKLKEKGFGVVEVLIIIVVIGLLGVVGWSVYDNRKNDTYDQQDSVHTGRQEQEETNKETKTSIKCDNSFKELKNEKLGISLCYPETWKTEIMDTAGNHVVGTIGLTSPDYKEEESGFGGSNTGSRVSVSVYRIDRLEAGYTPVSKILDGTEQSKLVYSDVKTAKIAGKDGASFISAYEGPRFLTNEFEYDGIVYSIALEEDLNGPSFNDNQNLYQKIVSSFQLLAD